VTAALLETLAAHPLLGWQGVGPAEEMTVGALGWLILVLVMLVVLAGAFLVARRRRRSGGVIATKAKP
jgi:uncharacterized membrane protein